MSDDSNVYAYFSLSERQITSLTEQYGSLDEFMKGMNNVELRMSTGKIYGEKGLIEMGAENYAMLSSTNGHPGANGNISVGVSTVGGMLFGTIGLLFVVPTLFIVFQTIQEHFKRSGGR